MDTAPRGSEEGGVTPKQQDLLERLARRTSPALELNLIGSGSNARTLDALLRHGYVMRHDHPTVKDRRTGGPALAIVVTDAGRKALGGAR